MEIFIPNIVVNMTIAYFMLAIRIYHYIRKLSLQSASIIFGIFSLIIDTCQHLVILINKKFKNDYVIPFINEVSNEVSFVVKTQFQKLFL